MSRRDHDISRNPHDRRDRNSMGRPRPSDGQHPRNHRAPWQDGNYYQNNSYRNNFQYQNNSPSYSHSATWGRVHQWGGSYSQPYSTSTQRRSQNTQHTTLQSFATTNYQSHQPQNNKPIKNFQVDQATVKESPPLGSKEDRERALEESKDRLKKSIQDVTEPSSQSGKHENMLVTDNKSSSIKSISTKVRPRTTLNKTVPKICHTDEPVSEPVDTTLENEKQSSQSSLESKHPACVPEMIHVSKSSAPNRRSRSTSNSSNVSTCTSNKYDTHLGLNAAEGNIGESSKSKETETAKQRVIQELLSMSKVKLKEIVSNPRSRKFEFVMKYMMKESRTQQSFKQRQLAAAGIQGHNTLVQQDYEALLSDPDLAVSLSNLPAEMIETLETIFQLNSLDATECINLEDEEIGFGFTDPLPTSSTTAAQVGCSDSSNDISSENVNQCNNTQFEEVTDETILDLKQGLNISQNLSCGSEDLVENPVTELNIGSESIADSYEDSLVIENEHHSVTPSIVPSKGSEELPSILEVQSFESCTKFSTGQKSIGNARMESSTEGDTVCSEIYANLLISPNSENIVATHLSFKDMCDIPESATRLPSEINSAQLPEKSDCRPCDFTDFISSDHQSTDYTPIVINSTKDSSISNTTDPNDVLEVDIPKVSSQITTTHELTDSYPFSKSPDPFDSEYVLRVCSPKATDNACSEVSPEPKHFKNYDLDNVGLNIVTPEHFTSECQYIPSEHTNNIPDLPANDVTPEHFTDENLCRHIQSDLTNNNPILLPSASLEENVCGDFTAFSGDNITCNLTENAPTIKPSVSPIPVHSENLSITEPLNRGCSTLDHVDEAQISDCMTLQHQIDTSDVKSVQDPVVKEACVTSGLSECSMVYDNEKVSNVNVLIADPPIQNYITTDSPEQQVAPETTSKNDGTEIKCHYPIKLMSESSFDAVEHNLDVASSMEDLPTNSPNASMVNTVHTVIETNPKSLHPRHMQEEPVDLVRELSKNSGVTESLNVLDEVSNIGVNVRGTLDDGDPSPHDLSPQSSAVVELGSKCCDKPGIFIEMSNIVKCEREEVEVEPLQSNLPHNFEKCTPQPYLEVSTQTEDSSSTQTNLVDVLQLIGEACQNASQKRSFNKLKEVILKSTGINTAFSLSPLSTSHLKSIGMKRTRCQSHDLTQKPSEPTSATNGTDVHGSTTQSHANTHSTYLNVPSNLDTCTIADQETQNMILSDNVTNPQDQLKLLFHKITQIENQIETWMEMKKKLYEKVNHILEDEKSQCSTSSKENDILMSVVTEGVSPGTKKVPLSGSKPSRRLRTNVSSVIEETSPNGKKAQVSSNKSSRQLRTSVANVVEEASPISQQTAVSISRSSRQLRTNSGNISNKAEKNIECHQSSMTLPAIVSFPVELHSYETNMCIGVDKPIVLSNEITVGLGLSKVKEETSLPTANARRRPIVNKSKRKRKPLNQPKRVSRTQIAIQDETSPATSILPLGKRSSRNSRSVSDVMTNIELDLLTNASEERSQRNRERNAVGESSLLSSMVEESARVPRKCRRRIVKELGLVSNRSEESLSRANNTGRARRSLPGSITNEESFECVLSSNLSRRTKGERKEMLTCKSNEMQNVESVIDLIPQRRATRHSICEPPTQELLPTELKRGQKRKVELDWDSFDTENLQTKISSSLPALPVMRDCSVVLEPLAPHLRKRMKLSIEPEDSPLSDLEEEQIEVDNENTSTSKSLRNIVPSLSIVLSSDDDDVPLFQIKQSENNDLVSTLVNNSTPARTDTDQNSVTSSDTAPDLGTDDPEIDIDDYHSKPKRNKPKKSKKEKLSECLEFADHDRGVILDIKVIGRHVLTASEDGSVYSYSIKSGKLKKKYEGHQAAVTCLCVIPGEQRSEKSCPEKLVTGSLDDHIRCFYFKTAELVNTPLKIGSALCIDYNWGIIYLGTKHGDVAKVNEKTLTKIGDHMKFSSESILALKATKEGPRKVLIVGTRDQPVAIRDADTGLFLRTVSGEWHHTVCSLLLDKSLVYCGTMSGPIPVFDFTNGREVFQLNAGVGVRCLKIYNGLLFAGCYDGNIYIYNMQNQSFITSLRASVKMVLCLDITRTKIICSSKDSLQALSFPAEVSKVLKEAKMK